MRGNKTKVGLEICIKFINSNTKVLRVEIAKSVIGMHHSEEHSLSRNLSIDSDYLSISTYHSSCWNCVPF